MNTSVRKLFIKDNQSQIISILLLSVIIFALLAGIFSANKVHAEEINFSGTEGNAPLDLTLFVGQTLSEEEIQHNINTLTAIKEQGGEMLSNSPTGAMSPKSKDVSSDDIRKLAETLGTISYDDYNRLISDVTNYGSLTDTPTWQDMSMSLDIETSNIISGTLGKIAYDEYSLFENGADGENSVFAQTQYATFNQAMDDWKKAKKEAEANGEEFDTPAPSYEDMNDDSSETTMDEAEAEVKEYATKDMLEGIAYEFARKVYAIMDTCFEQIKAELAGYGEIGSVTIWEGGAGDSSDPKMTLGPLWAFMLKRFSYAGAIIATLIFFFNLFLTFFQKTSELKHTPIQIIARYLIAMVILYGVGTPQCMNSLLTIFQNIMSFCFTVTDSRVTPYINSPNATSSISSMAGGWKISQICLVDPITLDPHSAIYGALQTLHSFPLDLGDWIGVLLLFVLSIPILKALFKLLFEIVERYLVLMFFITAAPLAVGFSVSKNSSNVAISYLKLVFTQTLLLMCNSLGLYGFSLLVQQGTPHSSAIGYIFCISYLIFAQRMDSYLQAMGLSAAHTGGGVLDNVGMALRNGMSMARMASRGIKGLGHNTNESRKAVGAGLLMAGLATGNKKLMTAGNVVGITGKKMLDAAGDGLGSVVSEQRQANMMGQAGREMNSPANTGKVMSSVAKCINNPVSHNQDTLRGYGRENISRALSSGLEGNPRVSHVDMNQLKDGELGFNATYGAGTPNAKTADMQISSMPSANSLEMRNSDGELTGMYLSSRNTLSNDGDTLVRNDAGGITASSMMSLTGVQNLSDTNLGFNYKDVHKVENRNGELGYMDKSGALLGVQNIKTGRFSASYTPQPSGGTTGGGSHKNGGDKRKNKR